MPPIRLSVLGTRMHAQTLKSAYEMKNNLRLFERLFKIQKNGVFLFEIHYNFVLKILTIFYYAN